MAYTNNAFKKKDEELFREVEKLRKGTASDFNRLYELSEKYIYKIIYDILKDPYTTEDLMQETYLQIYNKIQTLNEAQAFYVWAGRIATNLTLRYIRKNRHEVLAEADADGNTDFVFEAVSEDNENFIPEAVLMDREKQRILAEILDKLSMEQKLCVQYFYYEEMSVKEIAKAFGCSEGTIKSRLNYARKSIKDAVIEMDVKHDTRLYSLASVPLFFLIFRNVLEGVVLLGTAGAGTAGVAGGVAVVHSAGAGSAGATGASAMGGTAVSGAAGSGAAGTVSAAAPSAGAKAAGGVMSKFLGTAAGKAVVGVAAATVMAGAGYGIYHAMQTEPVTVQENYINMITIYYEIPATQLGYANPFAKDDTYELNTPWIQVSASVYDSYGGEQGLQSDSFFYESNFLTPEGKALAGELNVGENTIIEIQRKDLENVETFINDAVDYETIISFFAENAENYVNADISDSAERTGSDREDEVKNSRDNRYGIWQNEPPTAVWKDINDLFPSRQEVVIDGENYDFHTAGAYMYVRTEYGKYLAAEGVENPVPNRKSGDDVEYAYSVVICVQGYTDENAKIENSKYVEYKSENGEFYYRVERWQEAEEVLAAISSAQEEFAAPDYCMHIEFGSANATPTTKQISINARRDADDGSVMDYYGDTFTASEHLGIDDLYTPASRIWAAVGEYMRANGDEIPFYGSVERCRAFYETMEQLIGPGIYFTMDDTEYYFKFDYTNTWKMFEQNPEAVESPVAHGEGNDFLASFYLYGNLITDGSGGEDILPDVPGELPFYIFCQDIYGYDNAYYRGGWIADGIVQWEGEHGIAIGNYGIDYSYIYRENVMYTPNELKGEYEVWNMSPEERKSYEFICHLRNSIPVISEEEYLNTTDRDSLVRSYFGNSFKAEFDGHTYLFEIDYLVPNKARAYWVLSPDIDADYDIRLQGIAHRID